MLRQQNEFSPAFRSSRPESIIDSAQAPELALTAGELARLDAS